MELGLAHSLSRYKLKFSPDKIDTMIVQVNSLVCVDWMNEDVIDFTCILALLCSNKYLSLCRL